MSRVCIWPAAVAAALSLFAVSASEALAVDASMPPPKSGVIALVILPPKTQVEIKIAEQLSSKTLKIGDGFTIELAAPILQQGSIVVPAGVVGRGEVVHVAKAGWGGRAGELILAVRYLDCGGERIPLGHFHFSESGSSNVGGALVAGSLLLPAMFMVTGGEVLVPAGTSASAQLTAAVALPDRGAKNCEHPAS